MNGGDKEESIYQYYLDYDNTDRSGNYTVNITVFAGKTRTNTEKFFVSNALYFPFYQLNKL